MFCEICMKESSTTSTLELVSIGGFDGEEAPCLACEACRLLLDLHPVDSVPFSDPADDDDDEGWVQVLFPWAEQPLPPVV